METRFTFALGLALAAAQAFGAVYYVAVDGSDSAAGTKDKPFATLNKANKVVSAGDTVWIRGGIYDLHDTVFYERYKMTAGILLTTSGESDNKRIHYLAYPGERPIFDATNLPVAAGEEHSDGTPEGAMYTSPIVIAAKFLHLKGFEVRNTPMIHNSNSGIFIYASKHIFLEQIDSHHNADGSLPNVDFLKLKEGSRAIDKGEDVGLPFEGSAPDLGAFEYGSQVTSIAARPNRSTEMPGSAAVFDLQGRHLGTLQTMPKKPGVYLVRHRNFLQKMYIK